MFSNQGQPVKEQAQYARLSVHGFTVKCALLHSSFPLEAALFYGSNTYYMHRLSFFTAILTCLADCSLSNIYSTNTTNSYQPKDNCVLFFNTSVLHALLKPSLSQHTPGIREGNVIFCRIIA